MANHHLTDFWLGMTASEIAAQLAEPDTVTEHLEEDYQDLKRSALLGIINRAETGDVAAVSWLEAKGFLHFRSGDELPQGQGGG